MARAKWCAVLAVLLAAACAVEDDGPRELTGRAGDGAVLMVDETTGTSTSIDDDSLCACEAEACRRDWVLEHVGCDVCVVVLCSDAPAAPGEIPPDGHWQHACAECPSPTPQPPNGTDEPCSIAVPR